MRRRDFIKIISSSAAAWPLAASAQQPAMPVIGFLNSTSLEGMAGRLGEIRQGLKENGFVEGENIAIEYRWAENQMDLLPALATELVQRRVAVIVAPEARRCRYRSRRQPLPFPASSLSMKIR